MNTIGWIVALLILVSICLLFFYDWSAPITEKDAETSVLEDLEAKYGEDAELEIISIAENQPVEEGKGKYFTIKARVTLSPSSKCPERIHLYYNYPEQGFVTQPPDYITKNCEICVDQPMCYLIFNEEAIIASHTINGTENVKQYLNQYPNAKSTISAPTNGQDNWIVTWDSDTSEFYYVVELTRNAQLIDVISEFKD